LLYPILFLSILEIMRVPYLGDPRAFPAIMSLVVAYWLFRERRQVATGHAVRLRGRGLHTVRGSGFGARAASLLRRR
jgi:hypothetical protein